MLSQIFIIGGILTGGPRPPGRPPPGYAYGLPNLKKDLQTEPQKMLCAGVVKQAQIAWLIPTNN